MQYSVHTIKVKEIQNLYKTKHGRKYSLRYSGKVLATLTAACALHPTGSTALAEARNTDFLELSAFKRIEHIF